MAEGEGGGGRVEQAKAAVETAKRIAEALHGRHGGGARGSKAKGKAGSKPVSRGGKTQQRSTGGGG